MATIGTINIYTGSQDAEKNTSKITVSGYCQTTNGYWRGDYNKGTYTIKQDGVVLKSGSFTSGAPANKKTMLFSVELTVNHKDTGESGTISVTFNYASGFCTGSQSKTLTTIDRKSTLSVSNGTLGKEQTLTIDRKATAFTHSIKAVCGSSTRYIKADGSLSTSEVKHTDCSIPFVPPYEWAEQNTTGISLSVTYTITTYNGTKVIGTKKYTRTYSIPSEVAPEVKWSIVENTEAVSDWGVYVQYVSTLKVDLTITPAYGSEIVSCKTTIEGKEYTEQNFVTSILTTSGTLDVNIQVTDERGHTMSVATGIDVLSYQPPVISEFKVKRVNAVGNESILGAYGKVTFGYSLNEVLNASGINKNGLKKLTIEAKRTSDTEYIELYSMDDLTDKLGDGVTMTDDFKSIIFPAATNSSYNVRISVVDSTESITAKNTALSTGFAIIHWLASGLGFAIGKVAELSGVLDIGFKTRFFGGILMNTLEDGTDADTLKTTNSYKVFSDDVLVNMPENGVGGVLEVFSSAGESSVQHKFHVSDKKNPRTYERAFFSNKWGSWVLVCGNDAIVEQGTSGIWTYRKWRSGICEFWGTDTFTPNLTSSGTFHYENRSYDLPFELDELTSLEGCVVRSNFISFVQGKSSLYPSQLNVTYLQHNNASENEVIISLSVKGIYGESLG